MSDPARTHIHKIFDRPAKRYIKINVFSLQVLFGVCPCLIRTNFQGIDICSCLILSNFDCVTLQCPSSSLQACRSLMRQSNVLLIFVLSFNPLRAAEATQKLSAASAPDFHKPFIHQLLMAPCKLL